MNRLTLIPLAACLAGAALTDGCSRQSTEPYLGASPPTATQQKATPDAVAQTDQSRSELARQIEQGNHIDLAAIDAQLTRIRQDMIIDRYLEKLYEGAVSDQAVESYYREHISEYASKEIELSHILLRIPSDASDEQRAALNTRAHDLISRLHAGENFAVIAQENSDDEATAAEGGALGWVAEHELDKPLIKEALELSAGEVSAPLHTGYGIHIFKALSSVREVNRPIAEVRPRIVQTLRANAKASALEQFAMSEQ